MNQTIAVLAAASVAACLSILPAAAQEETTLILATALPPNNPLAVQILHPWSQRVNEAGTGKLKIDIRDGMAIANLRNSYDRVVSDVAQISWLTHNNFPGQFNLSLVGGLPYLSDTSEHGSVAMYRLYKSGVLDAEYNQVLPISLAVLSRGGLHLRRAPQSLDQLKGLKVIVSSRASGEVVTRIGMAPIALTVTEMYEAIQRATVDGAALGWTAVESFKLDEVTSYHANASFGTSAGMLFVNKKRYEALPAAARAVLDRFSVETESRELGKFWDRLDKVGADRVRGLPGHQVVELPAETQARWKTLAEPVAEEWAKSVPNGEKVLAAFRAELAKVKAGQ
jgi:TRAP-type C4-dicarboxylate transport system substrate-binding protein